MDEAKLTRKGFLKNLALAGVVLPLRGLGSPPAPGEPKATRPGGLTLYIGEPGIGEPGYAQRVARIFDMDSGQGGGTSCQNTN